MIKKFESFNIEDCEDITFGQKMDLEKVIIKWRPSELERIKKLFVININTNIGDYDEYNVTNSDYMLTIKVMYDYKFCIRCTITKVKDEYYTISHMEENSLEAGKSKFYYKCDQIYGIKSYSKFFKSRFNDLISLDYSSADQRDNQPKIKLIQ